MLRVTSLTAGFLALAATALAQAPILTIEDAVSRTLERNPATRSATASADEARARTREATAGYLPRVDAFEGWQRGDHPVFVFSSSLAQGRFTAEQFAIDVLNNPDALTNHRAAITVEQTIFDGGLAARVRGARAGLDQATLAETRVRADLRLAVVTAFATAAAATARHATARTALEAAREDLRRTEARRDAGLETEAHVLALQVHAADADARRVRAEADEAVARAELSALMREPLDTAVQLAPLQPGTVPPPGDLASLEARALADRPEIRESVSRRAQAMSVRTAARGTLLPRVVAQGAVEANGESFGDRASAWAAGLEVRWTLFNGANLAHVKAAAAAEARAAAEEDAVRTDVLLDVRRAYAAHRAATAREIASRRMVEQATESQRIIRDRYDAGLASATDLLRAATTVQQSEADRIAALADVHTTAASLARAVGTDGLHP